MTTQPSTTTPPADGTTAGGADAGYTTPAGIRADADAARDAEPDAEPVRDWQAHTETAPAAVHQLQPRSPQQLRQMPYPSAPAEPDPLQTGQFPAPPSPAPLPAPAPQQPAPAPQQPPAPEPPAPAAAHDDRASWDDLSRLMDQAWRSGDPGEVLQAIARRSRELQAAVHPVINQLDMQLEALRDQFDLLRRVRHSCLDLIRDAQNEDVAALAAAGAAVAAPLTVPHDDDPADSGKLAMLRRRRTGRHGHP